MGDDRLARFEKQLAEETKKLQERLAEQERVHTEQDQKTLRAAIQEAGIVDVETAFRYLGPDLSRRDGELYIGSDPLNVQTVGNRIPGYFPRRQFASAPRATGKIGQRQQELDEQREKYQELLKQPGTAQNVARVFGQKNVVAESEKQLWAEVQKANPTVKLKVDELTQRRDHCVRCRDLDGAKRVDEEIRRLREGR